MEREREKTTLRCVEPSVQTADHSNSSGSAFTERVAPQMAAYVHVGPQSLSQASVYSSPAQSLDHAKRGNVQTTAVVYKPHTSPFLC